MKPYLQNIEIKLYLVYTYKKFLNKKIKIIT
jgi:hypothetical protein